MDEKEKFSMNREPRLIFLSIHRKESFDLDQVGINIAELCVDVLNSAPALKEVLKEHELLKVLPVLLDRLGTWPRKGLSANTSVAVVVLETLSCANHAALDRRPVAASNNFLRLPRIFHLALGEEL